MKDTKEWSISRILRKTPNLLAGLIAIRKMHMRAIRESGFTCADEMLLPGELPLSF